ncbi:MAG: hypothetical protein D9V47_03520 [Clostridia bacterium]|nr:MAG: hypothetical protein D9V47_03520 [Clostridia bacterium]
MSRNENKTGKGAKASWVYLGIMAIVVFILLATKYWITDPQKDTSAAVSAAARLTEAREAGLPVWLLFHSSSCDSCLEMEAIFEQLQPEFKGQVAFVDVDVYNPAEEQLLRQYGIQYIPTSYLLGKDGKPVADPLIGVVAIDEMRQILTELAGAR